MPRSAKKLRPAKGTKNKYWGPSFQMNRTLARKLQKESARRGFGSKGLIVMEALEMYFAPDDAPIETITGTYEETPPTPEELVENEIPTM